MLPRSEEPGFDTVPEILGTRPSQQCPRTFKQHYYYLNSFRKRIPTNLTVADLKPHHVIAWLDKVFPAGGEHPYTDNTRHNAIASVKRVFNWAVDLEYIDHNPVARLKKPPKTPRSTYFGARAMGGGIVPRSR